MTPSGGRLHDTEEVEGIEPAVRIFEHSAGEFRLPLDRSAIRRAVTEAVRNWPGPVEERWWKWLVEAGETLDIRISVVECSLSEAMRWVEEGLHLTAYLETADRQDALQHWLTIDEVRRGKVRILQQGTSKPVRWIRQRELKRLWANAAESDLLRCVTLEPVLTCDPEHHEQELFSGRIIKPLSRTFLVLRAEWSDIWVVLVFSLVSGILALATPMAVQTMVSLVAFGRLLQPVIVLSIMLLALMVFRSALRIWETYIVEVLQRRLFARVSHDLSYRLPRVQQSAIDDAYGPELTNRFFDVLTLQKVTAQFLLDAVDLAVVSFVGMIVLAVYHPLLLGLDLILLVSIALIIFVLGRNGVRTSIQESKYKYYTAAWLEEITRCPLTFKLDNASEFAADRSEHFVSGYLENRRLHFRVLIRQIAFALGIHALAGSVLLGVGGWLVIQGQLTLGQLVAAEMIVAIVIGAFNKMGKHLESYYDLMAGIDKLGVLFDLPLEPQGGLMRLPEEHPAELLVRRATFSYGTRLILDDFSMAIESGERIALTGKAGCGKSTLSDLLYGLRNPAHGHVLLDGHDMRDVRPDVWRRHVMLLRSVELFHGSITANIHLEHPNIDLRFVREACETLQLMDVHQLPEGLETILTSSGAPLSDSQMRRVILARAWVHRPRLLIIDGLLDPLSDDVLDPILDLLFDRKQPWTLMIVSAHPSILKRCDRTIRLASPSGHLAVEAMQSIEE